MTPAGTIDSAGWACRRVGPKSSSLPEEGSLCHAAPSSRSRPSWSCRLSFPAQAWLPPRAPRRRPSRTGSWCRGTSRSRPIGQMFVTERPGRVRVYRQRSPRRGAARHHRRSARVRAQGEAGLMGIAVDHLFAAEPVHLRLRVADATTAQWLNQVLRYRVRSDWKLAFDRYIIRTGHARERRSTTAAPWSTARIGMIWISMGDADRPGASAEPEPAQRQDPARRPRTARFRLTTRSGRATVGPSARPLHRSPQPAGHRLRALDGPRVRRRARARPRRRDQLDPWRPQLGWPCVTGTNNSYLPGDVRMPWRH